MRTLGKVIGFGVVAVACIVLGAIGGALTSSFGTSNVQISYVDFISVLLTALGVIITTLGVIIALLAVLGWRSIEDKLRDHSYNYIGEELKEGRPLRELIQRTIREATYDGVRPDEPDLDYNEDIDGVNDHD